MAKVEQPKVFLALKILSPILFLVGLTLIILAVTVFADVTRVMNVETRFPEMACLTPGLFILFLSIPCFVMGYAPKINKIAIKTQRKRYRYCLTTPRRSLIAKSMPVQVLP